MINSEVVNSDLSGGTGVVLNVLSIWLALVFNVLWGYILEVFIIWFVLLTFTFYMNKNMLYVQPFDFLHHH